MSPTILCFIISTAATNGQAPLYKQNIQTACANAEHLINVANKYSIDPTVVAALIWVESRWVKKAVSHAGACGLTQVIPKYSKYNCKQLFNTKRSIAEGVHFLNAWMKSRKKKMPEALACYNAGWKCLKSKYGKNYSRLVLKIANIYRIILKNNKKLIFSNQIR